MNHEDHIEIDEGLLRVAERLLDHQDIIDCLGDTDELVDAMLEVIDRLQGREAAIEQIYMISGDH